jgi:hypothetical protein
MLIRYLHILLFYIILLGTISSCRTNKISSGGFSGPVYRTDADLFLKKVRAKPNDKDTIFVLKSGLKYRIVDTEKGTNYLKMGEVAGYITSDTQEGREVYITKIPRLIDSTNLKKYRIIPKEELYSVAESDLSTYNKVIISQLTFGTMLLPIKIRRSRIFNNVNYERQFSTDLSVGPYFGYRFKTQGYNYNTHTTVGLFAGPTLIDFVSSTSQTGSPSNGANPDNMFGFTCGIGLVREISPFQIGIVYGADFVSGNRVKEWPYDGKAWFSLGIGYNFLSGNQ